MFIGWQLWSFRSELASWRPDKQALAFLSVAIVLYVIANVSLYVSWHKILAALSGKKEKLLLIFARSQLGKYLPGNVAHIAGRHIMARERGYTHSALLSSIAFEFAGLLSAAGTVSLWAAYSSDVQGEEQLYLKMLSPVLVVALPLLWLLYKYAPGLLRQKFSAPGDLPHVTVYQAVPIYILYLLFFALAGMALCLVTTAVVQDVPRSQLPLILGAFSLAWTLGFVTPGAPSGIGVRETALFYLLQPVTGGAEAVLIAVLLRIVTVSGDVVFWMAGEAHDRLSERGFNRTT